MPPELNVTPQPTWAARPLERQASGQAMQGGRYRLEIRSHLCPQCMLQTAHAFLLLFFLVADVETEREVSDVICSRCDPERFARLQALAPHLA